MQNTIAMVRRLWDNGLRERRILNRGLDLIPDPGSQNLGEPIMLGYYKPARNGRVSFEFEILKDLESELLVKRHDGSVLKIQKDRVAILPENHRMVGILWNGGWDDYIIKEDDWVEDRLTDSYPIFQTVSEAVYLRILFNTRWNQVHKGKAFRVVRHLDGGD